MSITRCIEKIDGSWFEFTLFGLLPLNHENPVCHINFYEALAYFYNRHVYPQSSNGSTPQPARKYRSNKLGIMQRKVEKRAILKIYMERFGSGLILDIYRIQSSILPREQ